MNDTQIARQEWSTVDKSRWGNGAWQSEPDKVQWVDAATGLDCLIVRGPAGALCGYVGVPESHQLFEKGYDDADVSVHGGLTFSDHCQEPTRETWERWRTRMTASEAEAAKYPQGDAAERLRTLGHLRDDFEAWREHGVASFICHRPAAGQPDKVWWLGFDCAHSGDHCPKYAQYESLRGFRNHDDEYRTVAYVTQQCAELAAQLVEVPS